MIYCISYDLNSPGQDYPSLYDTIKTFGDWIHPVDSTWFVNSSLSAKEIRDSLRTVTDDTDAVIITTASAPGAWFGLSDGATIWLKERL